MKKHIVYLAAVTTWAMVGLSSASADDLEALKGKWSVKKTSSEGQAYTQEVEIKKSKFIFRIIDGKSDVRLYAEGSVKLDKAGPFKTITFFNIKGGRSDSELEEVNDDRTSIYMLEGSDWTIASNFDKEREQKPTVDVYHKVETAQK